MKISQTSFFIILNVFGPFYTFCKSWTKRSMFLKIFIKTKINVKDVKYSETCAKNPIFLEQSFVWSLWDLDIFSAKIYLEYWFEDQYFLWTWSWSSRSLNLVIWPISVCDHLVRIILEQFFVFIFIFEGICKTKSCVWMEGF